ncbi:tetratricopeptide repeat protein [Cryptosporangium sp. NPDC048952]|uniref:tetratricopeptide repeat protein n=1 Tax=Cryptosporangium sp. NPDC048952 TaxID=3363961 RepID=UPI00371C8120
MTGSCARSGCPGSYDADGYCDECGRKAPIGSSGSSRAGSSRGAGASRGTGPTGSTRGTGPSRSTRSARSTRGTGRGRLGGGMLDLPRVPQRDPATAVLPNPQVAQDRRFCGNPDCGKPVGRDRDGRPGRVEGFCPSCRTPFSFAPSLAPGTLVSGRYEVLGCLAYGGLGWIYLARDKNVGDDVSDRWVVLKGLIDAGDPDAMAAAVSERRFLVTVDHPTIVKIHDFALHPDPKTFADIGYIVMEYVGGRSLRDLRTDAGAQPLPLDQVLAYGLEILPAFGYLHDRGLLYCDFKPDNAIHTDDRLKLVDLGAVRRIDDAVSVVWGTVGYQAPEVSTDGPSFSSDLYTVARTMAVLSFDFRGFSGRYVDRLPEPSEQPLLAEQESYHRLLLRATHPDPAQRFESAADLSDQLLGVLRQVLSTEDGAPRPATSTRFASEGSTFAPTAVPAGAAALPGGAAVGPVRTGGGVSAGGAGALFDGVAIASALPVPQVDPADPGAAFLLATRDLSAADLATAAESAPQDSVEVPIAVARARILAGETTAARTLLDGLERDWRIDWFRGLAALADGDPRAALAPLDAVYGTLPGELAPQLALAVAAEWAGEADAAFARYQQVWTCDHAYVSAAFGLARVLHAGGDHAGAIEVLEEVPVSSSDHLTAQVAAVRARLESQPSAAGFLDVSARIERLPLDGEPRARLSAEVLTAVLTWLTTDGRATAPRPSGTVQGCPLTERDVRLGLEKVYRTLARLAPDADHRIALVDRANHVRPRTLV